MVIWITGRARAGKSTTAEALQKCIPGSIILDGDAVRRDFPTTFDDAGRRENIYRISKLAAMVEMQGQVAIVACVSPRKEWRDAARTLFRESLLVYVPGGTLWPGTTYEEPDDEELRLRIRSLI